MEGREMVGENFKVERDDIFLSLTNSSLSLSRGGGRQQFRPGAVAIRVGVDNRVMLGVALPCSLSLSLSHTHTHTHTHDTCSLSRTLSLFISLWPTTTKGDGRWCRDPCHRWARPSPTSGDAREGCTCALSPQLLSI